MNKALRFIVFALVLTLAFAPLSAFATGSANPGCQNNGWGNGNQTAPGNSGSNNKAENNIIGKTSPKGIANQPTRTVPAAIVAKCTPTPPPPVNNAPTASDASYTMSLTETKVITLVANDTEDAASALVYNVSSDPNLVYNGDGTVTYTAPAVAGTYTFTFTVTDSGSLTSNVATITIEVTDV